MRIAIIGGSGHVGTYLVPRLVEGGHQVINVSRGERKPYQPHAAWADVEFVRADRVEEDRMGTFGTRIRDLKPDVVIDMICFLPRSARLLVDALRGQVRQFLHCGTIWVHGPSAEVPTTEDAPRRPFDDYGIQKAAIEALLLEEARTSGFPVTILHPGHIVGPGWAPLNPAGHFHPRVFSDLAHGQTLALPNLGLETVHHVHAGDVAQAFQAAIEHPEQARGESFHVVSPAALTLRGYAEGMAAWFGQPLDLKLLAWEEWRRTVPEAEAEATWDHIAHSPNCSIAKARERLGYRPKFRSLEAVQEAVGWLIEHGQVDRPLHRVLR
ncbi:MAG: NAD-dependent epimerase/dehydratase family protein [Acidobacteria bacterium]|nr:NAD-dependent epimerase/dehydratase family protein [Acidobacteriota bacterium]